MDEYVRDLHAEGVQVEGLQAHEDKLSALASQLIATASNLQTEINNAKTQTKRAYFSKKMAKVRKEVQQVLATLQLMHIMEKNRNAPDVTDAPAPQAPVAGV